MKIENTNLSRKEFLKLSAATLAYIAVANTQTGCSTLRAAKLPAMDHRKGLFLANCSIIDVEKGLIERGKGISIINEKILAVNEDKNPPSTDFEVIDVKGKYIIPGMIDAHCHTTLPCMNGVDPLILSDILIQLDRNYIQQIHAGVTTVRDAGSTPKMLPKNIGKIKKGSLVGPRINYCSRFINIQNSHPDIDPHDISVLADVVLSLTGSPQCNFTSTEDLMKKLALNYESNPNFLKLTMDDISVMCGRGKLNCYTDEHISIIMDSAAKHNLPVTAHIHRKFGFDRALQFGINMEHSLCDAVLSDAEVKTMADKKIANVPTLTVAQLISHEEQFDELPREFRTEYIEHELKLRREFLYNFDHKYAQPAVHKANMDLLCCYKKYPCEELYKHKKLLSNSEIYFNVLKCAPENLKKMKHAGVLIGCGTDAGVGFIYHGLIWRELEMLTRVGFSNLEALQCATINNAKILKMDDAIGSIHIGKLGDLVALERNPLKDITACREPLMVIKGGKLMYSKNTMVKNSNSISL